VRENTAAAVAGMILFCYFEVRASFCGLQRIVVASFADRGWRSGFHAAA
jgi:hypothetical protein